MGLGPTLEVVDALPAAVICAKKGSNYEVLRGGRPMQSPLVTTLAHENYAYSSSKPSADICTFDLKTV